MSNWIDFEQQRPPNGERVIVLQTFGLSVRDDTWTDKYGWLNSTVYISHWQPINAPGSYSEIMARPRNPDFVPPDRKSLREEREKESQKKEDKMFSDAIIEFMDFFTKIYMTEFAYRFSNKPVTKEEHQS